MKMHMVAPAADIARMLATEDGRFAIAMAARANEGKMGIHDHEGLALFHCAKRAGTKYGTILEIGTCVGHSATIMALATSKTYIRTLNPNPEECEMARANLHTLRRVTVEMAYSWDVLDDYDGPELDLIFVDGDHQQCWRDMPWWRWVRPGGAMLFHDYHATEYPNVVESVDALAAKLGRPLDVYIMDTDGPGHGMVGFWKREGE